MYTETALHAGSGSNVSAIDLPIQRERTTNFPNIQGSGIKGALRAELAPNDVNTLRAFGNEAGEPDQNNIFAGSASFGEGRIILFPVCSLLGVFAYVTCPFVLGRLARDMAYAGLQPLAIPAESIDEDMCLVSNHTELNTDNTVILEEYAFEPQKTDSMDKLASWLVAHAMPQGQEYTYWRNSLASRLVVLPNDAFRDFVATSTEITTHIKINNETKTVDKEKGALWTKESLPAETLLASTVMTTPSRYSVDFVLDDADKVVDTLPAEVIMAFLNTAFGKSRVQLGGDETTGNGVAALNWFTIYEGGN